jgi:hypothetical protein
LLARIDYFNLAKAIYSDCQPALTETQRQFHDYLSQKFGWEVVPIIVDQTPFDPAMHECAFVLHVATYPDNVILRILRDGYTGDGQMKRWAQVAVNRLTASWINRLKNVRPGRIYIEMQTPQSRSKPKPMAIQILYDEAANHFKIIDTLYSVLAIFQYSSIREVEQTADILRQAQNATMQALCIDVHAILDSARLDPLRLAHAHRDASDAGLHMLLTGAKQSLEELHVMVTHYAANRERTIKHGQIDEVWFRQRLREIRPRDISGVIRDGFVAGILELLGRMTFGPDLLKGN